MVMTNNARNNNVRVLESKQEAKSADLINPVEALWNIELLYGKTYQYSELTYGLYMQTKLVGAAARCYLVIDLVEDFDRILRELNIFGAIERTELMRVIDYAKQLKIKGVYRPVPDLMPFIDGQSDGSEGQEFYRLVVDYIQENDSLFPTVSSGLYSTTQSLGVVLDTENYVRKFGESVVGVSSEALYEILELESVNSKRLIEITRSWQQAGWLVKKNGQSRLQEAIRPVQDEATVKRFYLIKLDI